MHYHAGPADLRSITTVAAARDLFKGLAHAPVEFAGAAYLARDQRVLGMRLVRGGRDWVELGARTLTIDALAFGASGIVLAHNHPSGDSTPSVEDLAHARRVSRALTAIGISVIDHLVIAGSGTVSLRAMGIV